jgi:hypothetical protein
MEQLTESRASRRARRKPSKTEDEKRRREEMSRRARASRRVATSSMVVPAINKIGRNQWQHTGAQKFKKPERGDGKRDIMRHTPFYPVLE